MHKQTHPLTRFLVVPFVLAGLLLTACGGSADRAPSGPLEGGADAPEPTATILAPTNTPESDPNLLLPDMSTIDPVELYVSFAAGRKEIRFSTTVENAGKGPVHVVGALDPSGVSGTATQIIERQKGGPLQRVIGRLNHDRQHGHWHLDNFAVFELWTYDADGGLERMLTSTPKITFCLLDMFKIDPPAAHVAENAEFVQCNWREQGISEGWAEVYPADLPGQELDITGVPDGRYALRTVLDPLGQFLESDTSNNISIVFVELTGSNITLLDRP